MSGNKKSTHKPRILSVYTIILIAVAAVSYGIHSSACGNWLISMPVIRVIIDVLIIGFIAGYFAVRAARAENEFRIAVTAKKNNDFETELLMKEVYDTKRQVASARQGIFGETELTPVFEGSVLVCEDTVTNQLVTKEQLGRMGFDVTIAPDGKTGVDIADSRLKEGKPFRLIFMDMHMPEMNGIQAAEMLSEIGSKAPIIALTADRNVKFDENLMTDYLVKPVAARALRGCVSKHLIPAGFSASGQNADCKTGSAAVDTEAGLAQYDGDLEVYRNTLKYFARNNREMFNDLSTAINEGDMKKAYRLAHSLRGAAGTIGASGLADSAGNLEAALSDNSRCAGGVEKDDLSDQIMTDIERAFKAVFDEINCMAKETNPCRTSAGADREKTAEILNRIAPYLETGDSVCLKYLDDIKVAFKPVEDDLESLIIQIEHFDFELAYATLNKIRSFIGLKS